MVSGIFTFQYGLHVVHDYSFYWQPAVFGIYRIDILIAMEWRYSEWGEISGDTVRYPTVGLELDFFLGYDRIPDSITESRSQSDAYVGESILAMVARIILIKRILIKTLPNAEDDIAYTAVPQKPGAVDVIVCSVVGDDGLSDYWKYSCSEGRLKLSVWCTTHKVWVGRL